MPRSLLQRYQWIAGIADASTGVCLLTAPAHTMRLLGVSISPAQGPYLSYIGVFVLGIGLSYFLCGRLRHEVASRIRWEMTWKITALCRSLVAIFVVTFVALGKLTTPWLIVACTDATLACFQWIGLNRRWLHLHREVRS